MSDGKGQDRNARIGLTRPAAGRLDLKKAGETSTVRQSFSHGRSKAVAVEVKKTRPMMPAGGLAKPTPSHANTTGGAGVPGSPARPSAGVGARPVGGGLPGRQAPAGASAGRPPLPGRGPSTGPRRGMVLKPLTDEEKAVRLRVLGEAKRAEEEARQRAEEN